MPILAPRAGIVVQALELRRLLSRIIYVDPAAPGPTRDGSSWQAAYTDLQVVLSLAGSGDEIRLAGGDYKPTTTTDRAATFSLHDSVRLIGSYAGRGAADPDLRDRSATPSTLSGNVGSPTSSAGNVYHVVTIRNASPTTVLDGLTITGGTASGSNFDGVGGGIYVDSSQPQLIDCTFTDNRATSGTILVANFNTTLPAATEQVQRTAAPAPPPAAPVPLRGCFKSTSTSSSSSGERV
jgi:hypothetical protein